MISLKPCMFLGSQQKVRLLDQPVNLMPWSMGPKMQPHVHPLNNVHGNGWGTTWDHSIHGLPYLASRNTVRRHISDYSFKLHSIWRRKRFKCVTIMWSTSAEGLATPTFANESKYCLREIADLYQHRFILLPNHLPPPCRIVLSLESLAFLPCISFQHASTVSIQITPQQWRPPTHTRKPEWRKAL